MGQYFGRKLREWRDSKKISGNKLAQLSGLSQSVVNGIELGRRPPSDQNLDALAAVTELGISLEKLQAWRDADRIGGDEGIERLKKHVAPGFELDRPSGYTHLGILQAEVDDFWADLRAFNDHQRALGLPTQIGEYIDAYRDAYPAGVTDYAPAADGHPSDYWKSKDEAVAFYHALSLGEGAVRNLIEQSPDLKSEAGQWPSSLGPMDLVQGSFRALQAEVDALKSGPSSSSLNLAGLFEAMTRHNAAIEEAQRRYERMMAQLGPIVFGMEGEAHAPSAYSLEKMGAIAEEQGSPLTADEAEVIKEAESLGLFVKNGVLNRLWGQSPEQRAWMFGRVRDQIRQARENPNPYLSAKLAKADKTGE